MKSPTSTSRSRYAAGRAGARSNGKPQRAKLQRAGRPTLDELERRKAYVMEVATDLFVHHGYAGTSLVDIAKAAGVATRTLYQHFGDKEAIFMEVVTARESGAVFRPPSLAEVENLHEGLMAIARYVCDVSFRPRSVDLMRVTIAESRRFPDFMMNLIQKTFAHFRASVASMFDELTARKLAPAVDSAKSAALFTDLILGATPLLVYAGWASSRPTDAELEEKIELFILGRYGPNVAKRARGTKAAPADDSAPRKPSRKTKAAA
jgi:AcrR family transcriptional regulator